MSSLSGATESPSLHKRYESVGRKGPRKIEHPFGGIWGERNSCYPLTSHRHTHVRTHTPHFVTVPVTDTTVNVVFAELNKRTDTFIALLVFYKSHFR